MVHYSLETGKSEWLLVLIIQIGQRKISGFPVYGKLPEGNESLKWMVAFVGW